MGPTITSWSTSVTCLLLSPSQHLIHQGFWTTWNSYPYPKNLGFHTFVHILISPLNGLFHSFFFQATLSCLTMIQLRYHLLCETSLQIPSRIYHFIFCVERIVEFITLALFAGLHVYFPSETRNSMKTGSICPFIVISSGQHTVFIEQ